MEGWRLSGLINQLCIITDVSNEASQHRRKKDLIDGIRKSCVDFEVCIKASDLLHVVKFKAFKIGKLTANTIRKRQYYSEVVQFVGNGGRVEVQTRLLEA